MSSNRTSIHKITSDNGLSVPGKIYWFFINIINNLFAKSFVDKKLKIRDFKVSNLDKHRDKIDMRSSPSRKICDLFWSDLPWGEIKEVLGDISVLDIGCGRGGYGEKINIFSDGNILSYKGLDIKEDENWEELENIHGNFKFDTFNGEDLDNKIDDDINFIISQSVMEHVENDLSFFKQIKEHVAKSGKEIIQVHLFPAKASLWLYLWHGRRQYTERTVSKISKVFSDDLCYLYKLGGKRGNRFHFKNLTMARIFKTKDPREKDVDAYIKQSNEAIVGDMNIGKTKSPVFFALIIHSNYNKEIF